MQQVEKMKSMESKSLSPDLDYETFTAFLRKRREKLSKVRPLNVAQASRISGVSPADISILLVYLEQMNCRKS